MDYLQKCRELKKGEGNDFKKKVYCITDKKGKKRFYYNQNEKKHPFIGFEKDVNRCLEATKNKININEFCKKSPINEERNKEIQELFDFINFLEEHTKETGDIDLQIFDFLRELVFLTNINVESLDEILKGAFTIIEGDGGLFHKKYPGTSVTKEEPFYMNLSSHWSEKPQHRNGNASLYNIEKKENDTFDLLMGTSILPDFRESMILFPTLFTCKGKDHNASHIEGCNGSS
jgi:hypothetical protein